MCRPLFLAALAALLALPAHASGVASYDQPVGGIVGGIAMHGLPKYADFTHLDYVNPDAPKGGTLRVGVVGTFDSLNPFIVRGKPALGLRPEVIESLMARSWDEPFSIYGLIAESVEVPEDRSSVTFRLRPEARWQDGTPITAEDVLFTYLTLRDKGLPNQRTYFAKVASAESLAPRTVTFTFKRAADGSLDREMPLIMGLMPVLPEHYWRNHSFSETTLRPPLGSGPYRVVSMEPGRSIVYHRDANYWGRNLAINRGQYNFDTIRYDYYRDDDVAVEAFKAGAFDIRREGDPAKWATAYDFPAAWDGRVKREELPNGRPGWMRGLIFNTRRPFFVNPRVREALGYAFDFEWINRELFHNGYQRIASYFPNSELAAKGLPGPDEVSLLAPYRAQLPPQVFTQPFEPPHTDGTGPAGLRANLRKAFALLAEAGWTVKDGRLVETATGEPFTFEILLNGSADERVALEFARTLERLGVFTTVRPIDSAQYQERLDRFDFDMTINYWASTLSPGNEELFYWGSASADQLGGRNYPGIRSPAIDALAAEISESPDRPALVSRVRALDRALLWGHYVIPLYYENGDRVAYWAKLRHPAATPVYGMLLETWWADPGQ
jgi:microcin C transport system substrate-binding protein